MQIGLKFDKKGAMLVNPRAYIEKTSEIINGALKDSGKHIMESLMEATPVGANGAMKKNWIMAVRKIGINNLVEIELENMTNYLNPVNYGRKASPISRAGMKSLKLWLKVKLKITDPKKIDQVAWAIARTKKKKATPGQKFVENTLEEVMPYVVSNILQPGIQRAMEV
jgi:hypothetical protein